MTRLYKASGALHTVLEIGLSGRYAKKLQDEGFERQQTENEDLIKYLYKNGLAMIILEDLEKITKISISVRNNSDKISEEIKSKLEEITRFKLQELKNG